MAHAAQVAFSFFADVAEKDEGRGKLSLCPDQRMSNGQHSNYASAVVACAWSLKAIAVDSWVQLGFSGEDGIEVRRQNNDWACAFRGKLWGLQNSKDIAYGGRMDLTEACFAKAVQQPRGTGLFSERGSGNCDEVSLPIHDGFRVSMEPRKGGVDRPQSSECGHT